MIAEGVGEGGQDGGWCSTTCCSLLCPSSTTFPAEVSSLQSGLTHLPPSIFLRTLPSSNKASETELGLTARSWMPPHCTILTAPSAELWKPLSHLPLLPHTLSSFVGGQGAATPKPQSRQGSKGSWFLWLRIGIIQNYGRSKNSGDPKSWTLPTSVWLWDVC